MSWVGMDQKSSSSNPLTTCSCSSPTATTARLLYFFGAMLSLLLTQSNFEVKLHSSPLLLLLQIFVNFFVHFKIWDMPWHSHMRFVVLQPQYFVMWVTLIRMTWSLRHPQSKYFH